MKNDADEIPLPAKDTASGAKEPVNIPVRKGIEVVDRMQDDAQPVPAAKKAPQPSVEVSTAVDSSQLATAPAYQGIVDETSNKDLVNEAEKDTEFSDIAPPAKKSFGQKLASPFSYWWRHKKLRYLTLPVLLTLAGFAFLVPSVRYSSLNIAGVRVPMNTRIVDSKTSLPLENIPVTLQGQEMRTDEDGRVSFDDLKLGATQLVVSKAGYAEHTQDLILGWGSNPVQDQPLTATGVQFEFTVTDWLTGKSVTDVEARSGEDIAAPNDQGVITLTVGAFDDSTVATIVSPGYRDVKVLLSDAAEEEDIALVPSKKHVFVSNRDGVYDLYKIGVDGKQEEILLKATGKEREIPHAVLHPNKDYVAYISTRDGEANEGGFIYDGLYVININNGESTKITRSEKIQIIGWSGDRLIYTAIIDGVSGFNPERSKLFSLDIFAGDSDELGASNYFNGIQLIDDTVYYSVSAFAVDRDQAKLFSIKPDGSEKQTVIDSEVWAIVHADTDLLHFQGVDESFDTVWYTQSGSDAPQQQTVPPVVQNTRYFSLSPDGNRSARVDKRDGKGVLLVKNTDVDQEVTVQTVAGLTNPIYWLNDSTLVYRVSTGQESADYVISLDGGEPKKIADVIGNQSRLFY